MRTRLASAVIGGLLSTAVAVAATSSQAQAPSGGGAVKQAQATQQQQQAQIDSQLATYRKAQSACLEGKGYSVK
jgi:hypothetical protein